MPSTTARVSVAITGQVQTDGAFPSLATFPASFERYLTPGTDGLQITKVVGETGTVQSAGTTVDLAAKGLSRVKLWYVENLADVALSGTADVTVAGGPVNGTVSRGQILLGTNDVTGWTATAVTVTGTAGTPFKIIAMGN